MRQFGSVPGPLLRSLTRAPLVLFLSGRHLCPKRAWDLEVPTMTHPNIWLARVVALLERQEES